MGEITIWEYSATLAYVWVKLQYGVIQFPWQMSGEITLSYSTVVAEICTLQVVSHLKNSTQ